MNKVTEFERLLESFKEDYVKFTEKGNKAAATRARKALQETVATATINLYRSSPQRGRK